MRREELPDDALAQGHLRADAWVIDFTRLGWVLPAPDNRHLRDQAAFRLGWAYGWAAREVRDREPTAVGTVVRLTYASHEPDIAVRMAEALAGDDSAEVWAIAGNVSQFAWGELLRGLGDDRVVEWRVIYDPVADQQVSDVMTDSGAPTGSATGTEREADGDN